MTPSQHIEFTHPTVNQRIVILGGGFAGTTLLKKLSRRLKPHQELILISEESYSTFNPLLPEVVGASIFPAQVVAPIREMFPPSHNVRFIMGEVKGINTLDRNIVCETLKGPHTIRYDQLILAVGNRAKLDLIPGMAEYALPLKSVGDAMHVRNIVLRRIARMELETDPVLLKSLGHFCVIGGGFSGVEVAGELVDCLHQICHYYPRVDPENLSVSILQGPDRLLTELPEALGNATANSLVKRGVHVHLNTRATEINEDCITLASGDHLFASTVISTIGTTTNKLIESLGLPLNRGRLVTEMDFSVQGADGLWALGDCAHVINSYDNEACPPTAQFAVRQAAQLAKNIIAQSNGKATQPFAYRSQGAMAAIGHKKGIALVLGLHLSGLSAWLLWRAYYLLLMPTLGRKVRIFVEWTWGMFFRADITHLRFTRSNENNPR